MVVWVGWVVFYVAAGWFFGQEKSFCDLFCGVVVDEAGFVAGADEDGGGVGEELGVDDALGVLLYDV